MKRVIPLFRDGFLLQGEVGGRLLQFPLLVGDSLSVLLDSGCASDLEKVILPGMREIGFQLSQLSFIINTHADVDHIGGNRGLKEAAPQALLCCGDADREQIESPAAIFNQRYDAFRDAHDHYYDAATRDWILSELGRAQPVDLTFRGGEKIRLSATWELDILHLPGHSLGHLGVFDRRNNTLFAGDAIHGSAIPGLDGKPSLPPSYLYVNMYLGTLGLIDTLDVRTLIGSHWPVKRGAEVQEFCEESRVFLHRAESLILNHLGSYPDGVALKELCREVGPQLGDWPVAANDELAFAFSGHLRELLREGKVAAVPSVKPLRYRLNPSWKPKHARN